MGPIVRSMKRCLALLVALLPVPVLADEPMPPPERETTCSSTGKVCAISDPAINATAVFPKTSRQAPWAIPGWHRWLFVSDDGESVVVGHSGMSLLPLDVTLEEPVLFFYNKGKLIRKVTLGELYQSTSQLMPTASHLAWAETISINRANQLVVALVNGRKIAFAANIGLVHPLIPDGT